MSTDPIFSEGFDMVKNREKFVVNYGNVGCQVSKGGIQKHYCTLSIAQFVDKATIPDFQIDFFFLCKIYLILWLSLDFL